MSALFSGFVYFYLNMGVVMTASMIEGLDGGRGGGGGANVSYRSKFCLFIG